MRTVQASVPRAARPPAFFCSGAAVGGMPVTGVGSPAGEILPLLALVALFVGAGVWMFRRFRPEHEPEAELRPELGERRPEPAVPPAPVGAPVREPVPA